MSDKEKYLATAAAFILGLCLLTFATRIETEIVLFGETFPVFALARAFGLIIILGSIITSLVLYGSSLPPTRSELEGQIRDKARASSAEQKRTRHGITAASEDAARGAARSPGHVMRTHTEARLRMAVEKKGRDNSTKGGRKPHAA